MDINQARTDYRTIIATLKSERGMRQRVLGEPRRSQALKEIDDALAALERLGQIVNAANQAGLISERGCADRVRQVATSCVLRCSHKAVC